MKYTAGTKLYHIGGGTAVAADNVDFDSSKWFTSPQGGSAPVVLSSTQGIDYVNRSQNTLQRLSGQVNPTTGKTNQQMLDETTAGTNKVARSLGGTFQQGVGFIPGTQQKKPGKITYLNTEGQKVDLSGESITPDSVQRLVNQGYYSIDQSGDVPSWANTGDIESGRQQAQAMSEYNQAKNDLDFMRSQLDTFMVNDSQLQSQIQTISNMWNARIQEMQRANQQREGSLNTLGVRLGSRYTGGMFGGIVAEEERQGVDRIADLEAKKQMAIAEAQNAAYTKNWAVFQQKVSIAEKAYNDKVSQLTELNKAVVENNKKMKEQQVKSSRDNAIGGLVGQGITDPLQLLDYLNYDDEGNVTGDFTLEEITKSLKSIQDLTKSPNLPADIERWNYLKKIGEIPNTTTFMQFRSMESAATRAPKSTEVEKDTNLFTDRQYQRMEKGGIDMGLADAIYQDVVTGMDLELIRKELRDNGLDPALLDIFDRVVNIRNITKGSGVNKKEEEDEISDEDFLNALKVVPK